jgi:antitoxin (DNA-binding transcriptional repressor) of toxin-antitoxin stability system
MRSHPSVNEVAENLSEYIHRVGRGERFVLMQGKTPVAELRPVTPERRLSTPLHKFDYVFREPGISEAFRSSVRFQIPKTRPEGAQA